MWQNIDITAANYFLSQIYAVNTEFYKVDIKVTKAAMEIQKNLNNCDLVLGNCKWYFFFYSTETQEIPECIKWKNWKLTNRALGNSN